MESKEILNSMKSTLANLRVAEHEMCRPHEDVMAMSVCFNARQSMMEMMKLYLLSNSVNPVEWNSLDDLLIQCNILDEQFSSIDLSEVGCKSCNKKNFHGVYCISTDKVSECMGVANKLKFIILEKMNINENEIN